MVQLVSLRLGSDKCLLSALPPKFLSRADPWVGSIWPSFWWPCQTQAAAVAGMVEADASALVSRVCG